MQSLWLPPTPALPLLRCLCGAPVEASQMGTVHSCCPHVCTDCTPTGVRCFSPECMAGKALALLLQALGDPAIVTAVGLQQNRVTFYLWRG